MGADAVQGPGEDGPPEGVAPADGPLAADRAAGPSSSGGSDLRGQLTAMRMEIEAHRRELEARLSELHEQAERAASASSADALAGEHTASPVTDDPPGAPARELAALRAELEQARDAAHEHAGRTVEASSVLNDLHRGVDDLRNELSELERRRATVQAETHALQRQVGDRTEEATRASERARVLAHDLERVREDERGRAAALRQAEVSLRRLRASAADLGAGLEREREEHARVAAALRSELEDQRRVHEAARQDPGQSAGYPFTPGAGLAPAARAPREAGTEICERLRGLERSVGGLGDSLRETVEYLEARERLPWTHAVPDDARVRPGGAGSSEGRPAEQARTFTLERTARELIGTARQLRWEYERELGSGLEREREAHARELGALHERVEHLRRELGQDDRLLRTELAAEQRARSDAEQQLATERERARARERVHLELERALEVERQRAAEDRKAADEISRALAQRVGSERRAHEELDRLRALLARDPVHAAASRHPGSVPPDSPASGPPAGNAPPGPPADDAPPGPPADDAPPRASAQSPGPSLLEIPTEQAPPGASSDGVAANTVSLAHSSTGATGGAQDAGMRPGGQSNGAWDGEISAARLGAGHSSVATRPLTPPSSTSGVRGANAGGASEGQGSPPGTDLADALTRAVQRLRDRADAAQAAPGRGVHGGLRRPEDHAAGADGPRSAPASWPPSLRGPSRLEALRGRPHAAVAAPTNPVPPAVIPGAVVLSAPSSFAFTHTTPQPWLADSIRHLAAGGQGALAGALLAELLPAQGLRCRRPLDFEIDVEGTGAFIVAANGRGRTEVVAGRPQSEATAALSLRGTPWQLAELIAGGSGRELPGVQVQGRRRVLRRLLRSRRLPLSLAELAVAGVCPWPGLLLAALARAVPGAWTHGEDFTVAFAIKADKNSATDDDANTVAAQARVLPAEAIEVVDGPPTAEPTATLHVHERALFDLLGGIVRGSPAQALVTGDPQAAHRLLAWFHRVQGLAA